MLSTRRSLAVLCALLQWGCATNSDAAGQDTQDTRDTQSAADAGDGGIDGKMIEVEGLSTPESVLYDAAGDVYLVSNINGSPGDADDNGFISRIAPDGTVLDVCWIDGASDDVTLNAPKGSAIVGDTFYVADITFLRTFHRETGAPLGDIEVEGARFLNDVAAAEEGTVYVSDSSGDAIYAISSDSVVSLFAQGDGWSGPNGLAADGDTLWVTVAEEKLVQLSASGAVINEIAAPSSGLDGLVLLSDRTFLLSSWTGEAVYQSDADSIFTPLFENLQGAADIGFDTLRDRVLIPLFNDNRLSIRPLR